MILASLSADLKTLPHKRVHIKTIPWKFRILNLKDSRDVCVPRPSALGPGLVGCRPQNIARLNTILLFSFEVVIILILTLKL